MTSASCRAVPPAACPLPLPQVYRLHTESVVNPAMCSPLLPAGPPRPFSYDYSTSTYKRDMTPAKCSVSLPAARPLSLSYDHKYGLVTETGVTSAYRSAMLPAASPTSLSSCNHSTNLPSGATISVGGSAMLPPAARPLSLSDETIVSFADSEDTPFASTSWASRRNCKRAQDYFNVEHLEVPSPVRARVSPQMMLTPLARAHQDWPIECVFSPEVMSSLQRVVQSMIDISDLVAGAKGPLVLISCVLLSRQCLRPTKFSANRRHWYGATVSNGRKPHVPKTLRTSSVAS